MDQTAKTLTQAIAMQEGGGSLLPYTQASGDEPNDPTGTAGGRYQFTANTWKNYAQQVLGDPNAPMTPENQNQVAYTKIKSWLDGGATPAQAASMWNAGEGSPDSWKPGTVQKNGNTPQYVANVQKYAQQLSGGQNQSTGTTGGTSSGIPPTGETTDSNGYVTSLGDTQNPTTAKQPTAAGSVIRGIINSSGIPSLVASGADLVKTIEGKPTTGTYNNSYLGTVNRVGKDFDPAQGLTAQNTGAIIDSAAKGAGLASTIAGGEGLLNAGKTIATSGLSGLLKSTATSALKDPEIETILKSALGNGETLADLSRQDAINTLGNTLKEQSVSDVGGQTEQKILKALKELNPTLQEKQNLIKKLGGTAAKVATGYMAGKTGILGKILSSL